MGNGERGGTLVSADLVDDAVDLALAQVTAARRADRGRRARTPRIDRAICRPAPAGERRVVRPAEPGRGERPPIPALPRIHGCGGGHRRLRRHLPERHINSSFLAGIGRASEAGGGLLVLAINVSMLLIAWCLTLLVQRALGGTPSVGPAGPPSSDQGDAVSVLAP
jgi:hypothetical protein